MTNYDAVDPLGSATDMVDALAKKRISAEELLSIHLDRIDRANGTINAVVTIDADGARKRARQSDERRAVGKTLGKLDGIPMTVKDSLLTAGLRTASGIALLKDHIPDHDALSVSRLKLVGANVFGKTNMPAMAGDIQTYNSVFGLTRNPWNLDLSPGGSSGGSAAALAMGFTPLEVGSDIAGSVRIPAHACGVYAHKPSLHVVPEKGHVPPPPPGFAGSTELGVIGPMARSAYDLEALFDVLTDYSGEAGWGWRPQLAPPRHETLRSYRVAIWLQDPCIIADTETCQMLERIGRAIEGAGATVDYGARPFGDTRRIIDAYLDLVLPYLAEGMTADAIEDLSANAPNLSNEAAKYVRLVAESSRMSAASYRAAKAVQSRAIHDWAEFFKSFDVVLCPVMPATIGPHDTDRPSWQRTVKIDGKELAYWDQALWCGALASFAFLPATVRPIKKSAGFFPMGVQVIGPFMEDKTALRFASLTDDLFGTFKAPPFASAL